MYCVSSDSEDSSDIPKHRKIESNSDSDVTIVDYNARSTFSANSYQNIDSTLEATPSSCLENSETGCSSTSLTNIMADPELESILKKYSFEKQDYYSKALVSQTITPVECITLSSDEEISTKYADDHETNSIPEKSSFQSDTATNNSPKKKNAQLSPNSKDRQIQENVAERVRKKEDAQQSKALAAASKNWKLEKSMKTHQSMGSALEATPSSWLENSATGCSNKNLVKIMADPELESILKKYSFEGQEYYSHPVSQTNTPVECIALSSDEETSTKDDDVLQTNSIPEKLSFQSDAASIRSPKKKKAKLSPNPKDRQKQEKAAERARKKEETQHAKLIKQALTTANKNLKPEESVKFITVSIDLEIVNEEYGEEIINLLQAAEIAHRLEPQVVPHTISWIRTLQNHLISSSGTIQRTSEDQATEYILILMNWQEAVNLIHTKQLYEHIKSLQAILMNKKLFLVIYGLQQYFRFQKSQKQKTLREAVTNSIQTSNSKFKSAPNITMNDVEMALVELQVLGLCCHRLIERKLNVGHMVTHFTKAVAQAPYKLEKHQKQQELDRYVWEDNKNVVPVTKDGVGLQRLWQQQLMSFPLSRIEHAEAIMAKYPTLISLLEEYSSCSEKEGEKLLQDLQVRRAAGPLSTVRKIGPELSKKIYTVLTSLNGDIVI